MSNSNAPYIKEIIERTNRLGGTVINSQDKDEVKKTLLKTLSQQSQVRKTLNDRTQTY